MNTVHIKKIDCVRKGDYHLRFTYRQDKKDCFYLYRINEFLFDDLSSFINDSSINLQYDFSEYLLMEDFLDALKCQIRSIILLEHSIKIIFKSDDKKKPSIQFIETQFFSLMVIYSKLHKIPVMLDLKVIAGSSVSDTEEYPVSQEIATKMSTKTLL